MDENRKEYAYILTIGKDIKKVIACGWWSTKEQMMHEKGAMSAAARAFKKTAGVLVYEKEKGSEVWDFCSSCDIKHDLIIPHKVAIDGMNITKFFFRDYTQDGAEYIIEPVKN